MQKIAADKVNTMECGLESTLVTIKVSSKIKLSTLLRSYGGIGKKSCCLDLEAFVLNYLRRCSRKYHHFEYYNLCSD